jgi:D-alanine--poly(phosphoribitol) ligase subunit 1
MKRREVKELYVVDHGSDRSLTQQEKVPCSPSELDDSLRRAFKEHRVKAALWKGGETLTYAQLFSAASDLAVVLRARVPLGSAIGILAQRSTTAYVGILAAVLCGRPYVPINMKFPYGRQLAMATIGRCAAFISDAKSRQRHEELDRARGSVGPMITDDAIFSERPLPADFERRLLDGGEAIAYIMFTSGTTGTPKGVAVHRENLRSYLAAAKAVAPIPMGARCTQLFDLSFDLSVHDMFRTWSSGGCLYVMDDEDTIDPVGFAQRHELECWFSVPSVIAMAKRRNRLAPGSLPTLRLSLFCGEPLPTSLADEWAEAAPNSRILNFYGPTEATIAITAHEYSRADRSEGRPSTVPLGRAFQDCAAVVMGVNGSPVEADEIGELWLGGAQISDGYINNDEENKNKFVEQAIPGQPYQRWYRTGDLVRCDRTHGLLFHGRIDDQIKIQGYRAELLDVEEALRHASGVAEVAAVAWPISETGAAEGVVGFVCRAEASQKEIIAGCRARLPSYMVPRKIVFIESLPLNSNGKVDRNALRATHLGGG